MKFRWKLLVLLLALSILPIVGLRAFGIHNVHLMADALTARIEKSQMDDAHNHLRQLIDLYSRSIAKSREQVEMALFFQAYEMERSLAEGADSATQRTIRPPEDSYPSAVGDREPGSHPPLSSFSSVSADACPLVTPEAPQEQAARDLDRLNRIVPVFKALARQLGSLALRSYGGLPSGVALEYPCSDDRLPGIDPLRQSWYRSAFEEKLSHWSAPYIDPQNRRPVTAISVPLEDEEETVLGVTSIVVPLDTLLESAIPRSNLPHNTLSFVSSLAARPSTDQAGAKILVAASQSTISWKDYGSEAASRWLTTTDTDQLQSLMADMAARISGIRRMSYEGRDSLWCYGPMPHQGTCFVFIVPVSNIFQPSQEIRRTIENRVRTVEQVTAGFLVLLIALNAGLALMFSRSITQPLEQLTAASSKLADGDFKARVDIRSRDEFGDLGRVFNQVGPQLDTHVRLQQAMDVAMQIQYNLLPQSAPNLSGLDVRGMAFFSEETGGDYFDYLCVDEQDRQRLCIAVGDVSGHGLPSALLMATARGLLRQRVSMRGSLGEIVTDVNQRFAEDVERSGRFMTLFLARIDRVRKKIEWVRAGHDPALLYDPATEAFVSLKGKGLPLGVDAAIPYRASSIAIEDGQVLFIGTDGIWETVNEMGELFGKDRLKEVIRQHVDKSARDILLAVHAAAEEFRGELKQEDDLTIVVVKLQAE
ncbi:MAG: SpoIIE family protein phosphatase [Desulfobacterales bacterium]